MNTGKEARRTLLREQASLSSVVDFSPITGKISTMQTRKRTRASEPTCAMKIPMKAEPARTATRLFTYCSHGAVAKSDVRGGHEADRSLLRRALKKTIVSMYRPGISFIRHLRQHLLLDFSPSFSSLYTDTSQSSSTEQFAPSPSTLPASSSSSFSFSLRRVHVKYTRLPSFRHILTPLIRLRQSSFHPSVNSLPSALSV